MWQYFGYMGIADLFVASFTAAFKKLRITCRVMVYGHPSHGNSNSMGILCPIKEGLMTIPNKWEYHGIIYLFLYNPTLDYNINYY
jgi:hypothetical protein